MDLDLIRTFIEVVEAGSFVKAAERLNVTQSTVSTRIKELELRLGRDLFQRSKAGTTLTGAGLRFQPHARTLLRAWQEARLDVGLPERFAAVLLIGAQYSLWDRLLLDWLIDMAGAMPTVALRAEVGPPEVLVRQLYEGTLDIGVMYAPQFRAGLAMRHLLTDELVLVAARAEGRGAPSTATAGPGTPGYVFIDWGPEFRVNHDQAFAIEEAPAVAFGLGALALGYIRERGGSGYLPLRSVTSEIEAGALSVVPEAPRFHRPAYAVYRAADADDVLIAALDRMSARAQTLMPALLPPA